MYSYDIKNKQFILSKQADVSSGVDKSNSNPVYKNNTILAPAKLISDYLADNKVTSFLDEKTYTALLILQNDYLLTDSKFWDKEESRLTFTIDKESKLCTFEYKGISGKISRNTNAIKFQVSLSALEDFLNNAYSSANNLNYCINFFYMR